MVRLTPRWLWAIAAAACLVLWLPPVLQALQATMTRLMLVQIPLLAAVGYWLGRSLPQTTLARRLDDWNLGGASGLVLASMAGLAWMLPRLLDASIAEPGVILAKFITVPLLIGLPLGISWPRAGFIVRGVFLLELVATCFRLGWLYLISPERLCSNYLLDDQQRLGRALLIIGALLLLVMAWKVMFGRFGAPRRSIGARDDSA